MSNNPRDFQEVVRHHYMAHGRYDLPWRQPEAGGSFDPYKIMVSELMLQQTQVGRVIPKYQDFLRRFPTIEALAAAQLGDVLRAWNGLGYNRRAKFMHQAVQKISNEHNGQFPDNEEELIRLPGIGPNTAGAILAYAFNLPSIFIETNIRTVYIHHFFADKSGVSDAAIRKYLGLTLDHENPREWYWALMDYGTYLKQTIGNINHRSTGYSKQSKFEGSLRQIRGKIIRLLSAEPWKLSDLRAEISDNRFDTVVADLLREGLIRRRGETLRI